MWKVYIVAGNCGTNKHVVFHPVLKFDRDPADLALLSWGYIYVLVVLLCIHSLK